MKDNYKVLPCFRVKEDGTITRTTVVIYRIRFLLNALIFIPFLVIWPSAFILDQIINVIRWLSGSVDIECQLSKFSMNAFDYMFVENVDKMQAEAYNDKHMLIKHVNVWFNDITVEFVRDYTEVGLAKIVKK